jgi:hypothetical protein
MSSQQRNVTVYIDNGPPLPGTLTQSQDVMWVSSGLSRPNQSWEYTDERGHFHAYNRDDDSEPYPTLQKRVEHVDCDGSCSDDGECEGYSETHHSCRICAEEITPGLLHGAHSTPVPGLKDWMVTVHAALPALYNADQVSVRMWSPSSIYFGVAVASSVNVCSDGTGESELFGNGALGLRKLSTPACPVCGAAVRVDRIDVSTVTDRDKVYVLGGETRCAANALHDVFEVAQAWLNDGEAQ